MITRVAFVLASLVLAGSLSAAPFVYVVSDSNQFGTVDLANGSFHFIASQPMTFYSIATSAQGLEGITQDGLLLRINPATGVTALVGDTGLGDLTDVTANLGGTLYTLDVNGILYTVNAFTGALTTVGSTGVPSVAPSDGFYASLVGIGGNLYFTLSDADKSIAPALYAINPKTASAALVGPTHDFIDAAALVNGAYYVLANTPDPGPRQILTIDPATGQSTFVANQDAALTGVFGAVSVNAIPEPATLGLLGCGLAGIGFWKRRGS